VFNGQAFLFTICTFPIEPERPTVVTVGRSGSIGKVQIVNKKAWPLNTTLYVTDSKGTALNPLFAKNNK
jgi:hypothetical protein